MMRQNPPKGESLSKELKKDWEKYYDKAYSFYKDKKRAAATAWTIAKKKYKKSSKTGKWIIKESYEDVKSGANRAVKATKKLIKGPKKKVKKAKKKK